MFHKRFLLVALIAIVLISAVFPAPAGAAANVAAIWLVHGIHGQDAGQATMQFPLDVWVDGAGCVSRSMMFMGTKGPIPVAPGVHTIQYSPADAANPCGQPAILSGSFVVDSGDASTIVAHLNAAGAQTVSAFKMDLRRSTKNNGKSRMLIANTAYSGAVDVVKRPKGAVRNTLAAASLNSGQAVTSLDRSGQWRYWFNEAGSATTYKGPMTLNTKTQFAYCIFLVGSASHGFFTASFSVNTKR